MAASKQSRGVILPMREAKLSTTHARALGGSNAKEKAMHILADAKADGIGWKRDKSSPNGYVWVKVPPNSSSDARFIQILKALHLLAGTDWRGDNGPKHTRSADPRTIARRAELSRVDCCSVPELVDVLIARSRNSNGFEMLTRKQKANLMIALLGDDR